MCLATHFVWDLDLKFIYYFIKLQHSIAFGDGEVECSRGGFEEETTIGDEIPSDINNGIDFESVMNKISRKKEKQHQTKCGSCSKVPSIAVGPAHADIDPEIFLKLLFNVMGVLEKKVKEAMDISESGVCPKIKPMDIFLKKNPYENYDELLSKVDALEALEKMNELQTEIISKIPEI